MEIKYLEMLLEYINKDIDNLESKLETKRIIKRKVNKEIETQKLIDELEKQVKKEEPRYLLQTDLTSENGVQYLSFDKKRREYFMGALMTRENVQQKFTDSEISKIKSITRFVEFCEKVEVE